MNDDAFFKTVGGRHVRELDTKAAYGVDVPEYWDFGWMPEHVRNDQDWKLWETAQNLIEQTPRFNPKFNSANDSYDLTELWSHPTVQGALGFIFPGIWQLTGSCVGAGGGNVVFSIAAQEVIRLGDKEQIIVPFWPIPYGRSRYHGGMRGRGEGSNESTWAKAIIEDGVVASSEAGLPLFKRLDGGIQFTEAIEYEWSAGDRAPCTNWLPKSRKHLIHKAIRCRTADDVRDAVVSGCPVGQGSMYGFNTRLDDGDPVGARGPQWSHKMSIQGFRVHPKRGEEFKMVNQWGKYHQGYVWAWIPKKDVQWICDTSPGEVIAYSQFDGVPSNDWLDWSNLW